MGTYQEISDNFLKGQTSEVYQYNQTQLSIPIDYTFIIHFIVFKVMRPPVLLFGVIGNILNILVLSKGNLFLIGPTGKLLISMSTMDTIILCLSLAYSIGEWTKSLNLVLATIFVYYSCFIRCHFS